MTELTGKDEVRVRRLSAREKRRKYCSKSSLTSLKKFDSCNEPYVRAQLAIATMKESQNKLICGSDKKVITQLAIATELINSTVRPIGPSKIWSEWRLTVIAATVRICLLYTSDAADE